MSRTGTHQIGFINQGNTSLTLDALSRATFAGNVGIKGTPTTDLDVFGNARIGSDSNHALQITDDSAENDLIISTTQRTTLANVRNIKFRTFGSNGTDNILYLNGGNGSVGIGTDSPTHLLTLEETDTNSVQLVIDNNNTSDAGTETSTIRFRHYRSYVAGLNDAGEITVGKEEAWDASGDRNSYMSFSTRTGASGVQERMRIDSSGNVGIGYTSPSSFNQRVNAPHLVVGSGSNSAGLTLYSSTGAQGSINFADGLTTTDQYTGGIVYVHGSDNYMGFHTNGGIERMRIDSSGFIRIGSNSSGVRLAINGWSYNPGSDGSGCVGLKQTGASSYGYVVEAATNDKWMMMGHNGTNGIIETTYATSAGHSDLHIKTGSSNAVILQHTGGNVLVGGDTLPAAASGAYVALRGGDNNCIETRRIGTGGRSHHVFYNANGVVGNIETIGSSTSYNTSSDYRLKEDLKDFNGLDKVSKIPVYDFKWKSDKNRSYGVMAHELQEVLPDAVSGEKDAEEMQGVDYSKIVPLLVKSIQELKAEVDKLKQECKCK
jgi:hypothetical protein